MLKELAEIIKNWLSGEKPVLIPIPVRNDNRFTSLMLLLVMLLCAVPAAQASVKSSESDTKTILFIGDSLTAGYGIDENQAYPALIQNKLNELDLNSDWNVINAGLSGETSSGGLRRVNWLLRSDVDVLVLALGANDGLRGVDLTVTESNLQSIIDKVREKNPDVKIFIAGMQVPPNLGNAYTDRFRDMFPRLASANDAVLIPFLLEDVAGISKLNLPDGIHPTPEGHVIMAKTVWTYLKTAVE